MLPANSAWPSSAAGKARKGEEGRTNVRVQADPSFRHCYYWVGLSKGISNSGNVCPPSTTIVWPVMYPASFEAKNRAALPISPRPPGA